jgi:hypothetical protein
MPLQDGDPPAVIPDQPGLLQRPGGDADGGTTDGQHGGEEVLGQLILEMRGTDARSYQRMREQVLAALTPP